MPNGDGILLLHIEFLMFLPWALLPRAPFTFCLLVFIASSVYFCVVKRRESSQSLF